MINSNSGKHARKVTLDAAVSNAIAKAVDARKVAAFTVGAAGVLAGAAFAFGATPAMAAESGVTPDTKPAAVTAGADKKSEDGKKADAKADAKPEDKKAETKKADKNNKAVEKAQPEANKEDVKQAEKNTAKEEQAKQPVVNADGKTDVTKTDVVSKAENKSENPATTNDTNDKSTVARKRSKRSLENPQPEVAATGVQEDRASNNNAANQDSNKINPDTSVKNNTKINIDENNADTMPNMYGWGSTENTFSEDGEKHTVTFHFAAPKDGKITNIAIFPAQNNGLNNDKSKRGAEYYSSDPKMRQSFSGTYEFTQNGDGSADLKMSNLFSKGTVNGGAEKYVASRSIFVYVTNKDGKEDVAYKTNVFRAVTLVPPKTSGSVVLKYNEQLTPGKVQAAITEAGNVETARSDKKSVNDQLSGAFTQNINVKSDDAYDKTTFDAINKETSAQGAKDKTYVAGAKTLNTYMVTDLGFKSGAIPLTVARYDDRIDKPIVEDPTKVSEDVKTEIKKKLAKINGVSTDKITFDGDNAVIHFDGVDEKDAPKIALRDLVLKKFTEDQIKVPAESTATVIYNPLAYSDAEIKSIKKAIYEANKDNPELGLSATDYENQISLEYLKGNLTATGHANQGISNGQAENTITVKIKTDKAVAEFTSDVKAHRLTRLADIRKDYNVSWKQNKIAGRDTDEGLSWSEDGKTIIYRYDSTAAKEFDTNKILDLLKATAKDPNSGLRDLTGNEKLDHEGVDGKDTKSHVGYVIDKNGQPTTELSLGNMSGAYWQYSQKVDNSGVDLGNEESNAGSYSWDKDAKPVVVAAKQDKVYKARLFVLPYGLTMYRNVYMENGNQPWNTPKAINVIFVPQTNHKTNDLKKSVEEHKTTQIEGNDVPTQSAYYNASDKVKKDYEDALKVAKQTLEKVGTTTDDKLSEQLKAEVDNATIKLDKAREALDGAKTNKDGLDQSIAEDNTPAQGQTPASGTKTTDRYKNVTEPDFKTPDGKADEARNNAAKEAKKAYDKALEDAKTLNDDENATQKAVDDAKAKLDEARAKLNEFTTNKDELNNAIAQHGHVNTGRDAQGTQTLKKADPTYQNSKEEERKAYDDAVAQADKVSKDPNASQKEVNKAIDDLKKAKAVLDANATDKAPLDAAVQKSFDNPKPGDTSKQSVFYKNAAAKKDSDANAKKAVEDYDNALQKAKDVLADKNATKKDVEDAKKALEAAEAALHAETYQTKATDLAEAIADNVSGYLMPAYFNAFDLSQSKEPADATKAEQAAKDFKAYNDAYHAAKDLLKDLKKQSSTVTQEQADKVKNQLIGARKVIDKYATDTSKISAALLHSLAITKSPAYINASAGAEGSDEAKAKKAYDDALKELQKAFNDQMDKDKGDDGSEIPESVIPDKNIDMTNADALKKLQQHAKGQPLNRDVTKLLAKLNDAVKGLDKFATKTDDLLKSVNEDAATHQNPAFKNASHPDYKNESGQDDTDKNGKASKAVDDYGAALNKAKELLKKPDATQKEVNDAKTALDNARKALDAYNTDVAKLKESVKKHGTKADVPAPEEGTLTSDAYRNASDPHFMKEEGGKLVPDTEKNTKAAAAKKAYDEALTKAQELLKKHGDENTPQDAKPIQKQIDEALTELDKARTEIEKYKTDTTALNTEAEKSQSDAEGSAATGKFEDTPEFKNAKAKTSNGAENADVTAYKNALKKARNLVKDAADQGKKNSERPTQQQINDALDALKAAKKQITDNYKTNLEPLTSAKDVADVDFKKTPEYKNAVAKKAAGDQGATNDLGKDGEQTGFDNVLQKVTEKLNDEDWKKKATQKQVNALLKQLQDAQDKIAKDYKTNAIKLEREVGDKDQDGKPVTPKFEESIPYKNALAKKNAGDTDATSKLKDYNDKLAAAQKIIDQVNKPDPNAAADSKPTQAQVDKALQDLKDAKTAIDNAFKTKVDDLKTEAEKSTADTTDPTAQPTAGSFESTTEYQNALAKKTDDGKDNADVTAYKEALKKARNLLNKFDDKGNPKSTEKDIPSQKEVDEALKNLKEIKDKITKNYVTSPHDLQQEVDKSKDGDTDTSTDVFENTPAFKNADAKKDGSDDNADMKAYKDALENARKLLKAFDRTTGKPVTPLPAGTTVPTQKELDAALKALQDAKSKIENDYATKKEELQSESDKDADFTKSPEYQNATGTPDAEAYKKALEDAKKVLGDANATQAQVDEALKKLQEAKKKITDGYGTSKHILREEHSEYSSFEASPEFINAISNLNANPDDESAKSAIDNYKKALEYAKSVLDDPNATQAQVDAALSRLRDAKHAITQKYATDKKNLKDEHDSDGGFENSPEFQNAVGTPEADAYKKALEDAKKVLDDPNATQAQVDEALKKLRDAKNALVNGHKTNKADLQNEADDDPAFRKGVSYLVAGSPEVDDYNRALDEARRVLSDPNATQDQVDAALRKLRDAKQRIIDKFNARGNGFDGYVPNVGGHEGDGYVNNASANANAVDKSGLQAEVNSALNVRGNSAAAQAYRKALADAKRVLADANATQAQVDAAVNQLRDAKSAFKGFGGSNHKIAKTGAATGLFAGLAAIFAGFGAAGVASRRRKHSND